MRKLAELLSHDLGYIWGEKEGGPNGDKKVFLNTGKAFLRALAKDLHISVITVQRAYEDLTRDGFIETVSGKGCFVAPQNKEWIQEEQLRIAEGFLEKAAQIGRAHGIAYERMANILKLFFEE